MVVGSNPTGGTFKNPQGFLFYLKFLYTILMTWIWITVFIVSLTVMLKGADWFLNSAERIGLAIGLSPFIIGVTIIAAGTSLPELISSLFAVFQGVPEIVAANVVGSNIANILLVIGVSGIIGKKLFIDKDIIDLDLPLLATTTALFLVMAIDGVITLPEGIILLVGAVIYILYTLVYKEVEPLTVENVMLRKEVPSEKKALEPLVKDPQARPSFILKDIGLLILGISGLVLGSKFLIDAVIQLSTIWNVATGVIAVSAIALGTSLPELLVSSLAAWRGNAEVAIGNIFGSNAFNLLVVIGIPALFTNLPIDEKTLSLGLLFLVVSTFLFIISGISRKIHRWEGAFFILIYIVFIAKLFGLF